MFRAKLGKLQNTAKCGSSVQRHNLPLGVLWRPPLPWLFCGSIKGTPALNASWKCWSCFRPMIDCAGHITRQRTPEKDVWQLTAEARAQRTSGVRRTRNHLVEDSARKSREGKTYGAVAVATRRTICHFCAQM